jgi:hypothetical protein
MTWDPAVDAIELAHMVDGRIRILNPNVPRAKFNYQFAADWNPPRKWEFDLAWPSLYVACEIQGGTWRKRGGAHRGLGAIRDMAKSNAAVRVGWQIFYYTPDQVKTDQAALELAPFLWVKLVRAEWTRGAP